jgi:hypothetical protein
MCGMQQAIYPGNLMQCNVNNGQFLDYRDIRNWSGKENSKKYSVRINCNGGTVYLPWPFKARNVVSLEIYNCKVLGFLSEMTTELNIADELKALILSGVSVEIPLRKMLQLGDRMNKVSRSADCGQLTLEKLVFKDIHYELKMTPEERDGVKQNSFLGNMKHSHSQQTHPCVYKSLKYLDESGSRKSGQYHLKLIPEYSRFPSLEVYNMSRNEVGHVPSAFRNLHSGKFPALRHIDFSNNFLRAFEFDLPTDPKKCKLEIIDLHNNQIRSVSPVITHKLKDMGTILVDLRQNPMKCGCHLAIFKQYLGRLYRNTSDIEYKQILTDITCLTDSTRHGKRKNVSILKATFDKKCKS